MSGGKESLLRPYMEQITLLQEKLAAADVREQTMRDLMRGIPCLCNVNPWTLELREECRRCTALRSLEQK